ncbi:hypothetical protein E4T56_gene5257 [Termitomyces sp. T112]|nr:hypothetical protein E4T56_gene5257 [Termitomyces sp. T112]
MRARRCTAWFFLAFLRYWLAVCDDVLGRGYSAFPFVRVVWWLGLVSGRRLWLSSASVLLASFNACFLGFFGAILFILACFEWYFLIFLLSIFNLSRIRDRRIKGNTVL